MTDLIRGFAGILSITLIRYFLMAGLVFVVVYLWLRRLLHNSKIQQRVARRKDFIREIINSVS